MREMRDQTTNTTASDPGPADAALAAEEEALTIRRHDHGGLAVFDVAGEVDVHTASQLERAVREALAAGISSIAIDVAEVAFIDSSGLRCLIALQRDAVGVGGGLRLRNPSRPVMRLLEVTGLADLFSVA